MFKSVTKLAFKLMNNIHDSIKNGNTNLLYFIIKYINKDKRAY